MNKNILYFISLTVAVTCMTSCSQFWGDLRKDWGKDSGKDWDESEAAVERTDRISARDSTAPEAYEPERRSRNRAPADDTQRRPVPVRNGGIKTVGFLSIVLRKTPEKPSAQAQKTRWIDP